MKEEGRRKGRKKRSNRCGMLKIKDNGKRKGRSEKI